MGDEVGELSTSLGLFASPPLIRLTESVVVMEWKGMSTAITTRVAPPNGPSGAGRRNDETGTARAHELGLS